MSESMNWRYATQKFDSTRKVSHEDLAEILEVLRLTPSSYGLQPWKFILVNDQKLREEIRTHAWNQAQITDASHLIVLCALKSMDETYIKSHVDQTAKTRNVNSGLLIGYEQMMLEGLKSKSPQELAQWMKNQVYITLGILLSTCAHKKIDACPMEGFNPQKVDQVLGLTHEGIESVVLCPIGYRAVDDRYATLNKVRFGKNEMIIEK